MTITIKNKKFQAAVHHNGKRWRRTFDSRDEALRWETSTKLNAIDGRPVSTTTYTAEPDSPTTLAEMIEYTNTHCWHDCKSGRGLHQNAVMVGEVIGMVRDNIGPVASFKTATVVQRLPKTRSGKVLRGTMQKIADSQTYKMPVTIDDPVILDEITVALKSIGYAEGDT